MSKAMELVQQYADASATWHVENLYGTSKSYTEECRKDKVAIGVDLFTELRRLADIEHEHRALLVNEQSPREELAALKASLSEPVGVIGADFTLYWAGSGPIAPIVEKHGLKVGSPLYAIKEAE